MDQYKIKLATATKEADSWKDKCYQTEQHYTNIGDQTQQQMKSKVEGWMGEATNWKNRCQALERE